MDWSLASQVQPRSSNRLQAAFIFAKANQSPEVVRESLAHLRHSLGLIINQPRSTKRKEEP
jgi:hypothetical protein